MSNATAGARKNAVDEEIERLPAGGAEDQRLNALASVWRVLLSEIYDDVSLGRCAVLFSGTPGGPSRHAIVVPDLSQIAEQLEGLTDRPVRYLIEGDPQSLMTAYSALTS